MLHIEIHYTKQAATDIPEETKEIVSCTIEFTMNHEQEFDQAIETLQSARVHYQQLSKFAQS
jgi:hypothetical protein